MAELSKEKTTPTMDEMAFKNEVIKKIAQLTSNQKKSKTTQGTTFGISSLQKLKTLGSK